MTKTEFRKALASPVHVMVENAGWYVKTTQSEALKLYDFIGDGDAISVFYNNGGTFIDVTTD